MQIKFKTVQGKQFELGFEDSTKVRAPRGPQAAQRGVIRPQAVGAGCRARGRTARVGGC